MNRYKKLVANSGIIALGTFGSKLLVYFLMPFYTSYLTPEMYSTADLITQTAKLLIPLLSVGITETVFRFALDKSYDKKEVFSAGVYTLLAGGILLACVIPVLSAINYFDGYVYIIIMYVFAANFHALATQYIRTKDHFKFYAVQGIINTGAVIVCNIFFLAVFNMGVTGYVLSVVIADLFTFGLIVVWERLYLDLVSPKKISISTVKDMLKYSIPLIPTTILWWITGVSDRFMVTMFSGDVENGLYSAAYKIPNLLVMLCTVFIQAWNFSSVKEDDETERSAFFSTVFKMFSGLQFIGGGFIIIFSDLFTDVMFEAKYSDARYYIPLLVVATIFSCMVSFFGSVYTVRKKSGQAMLTALGGATVNVVLNLLLIPNELFGIKLAGLGGIGAAIATFASYFTVFMLRAFNTQKHLPFDMKPVVLTVNSVCIAAQTVIATVRPAGYIYWQIPFFAILCLINAPYMLKGVKVFLGKK